MTLLNLADTATTTTAAHGNPVPGLLIILAVIIFFSVRKFAKRNKILIRAAFIVLGLYLLALIAPKAVVWAKARIEAVKAAASTTPAPPTL